MRKWLYTSVALWTCSGGLLACGDDFSPASAVEYVRVLAIAADPPEITDPGFSQVSALVVGAEGEVSYRWEFCPVPGPDIIGLVCLVPELNCLLGEEETATVFIPPLDEFLLSPDFSELYIDLEEGIEVQIRLTVTDKRQPCDDGAACPVGYRCAPASELISAVVPCADLFGLDEDPVTACLTEACGSSLDACVAMEACTEIFGCTEICPEDDETCVADCVSAASAAAGATFLDLVGCGTDNGCFDLEAEPVEAQPASPEGSFCMRQEEAVKGLRVARREQLNTNPSLLTLQLEADPDAEPVPWSESETKELRIVPSTHPMDEDLFYLFQDKELPMSAVVSEDTREGFAEDGIEQQEDLFVSWFTDVGGLVSERTGEFGAELRDDVTAFPNEWRPPSLEPGESSVGSIWAVIRDGRGGVGWLTRRLRVEAEP